MDEGLMEESADPRNKILLVSLLSVGSGQIFEKKRQLPIRSPILAWSDHASVPLVRMCGSSTKSS